jgi:ribosome-binding factor A
MPLGGKNYDEAIERLAKNKGEMRRLIGRKAALKHTPDFRFRIDETFDRMDQTRALFAQPEVKRDLED